MKIVDAVVKVKSWLKDNWPWLSFLAILIVFMLVVTTKEETVINNIGIDNLSYLIDDYEDYDWKIDVLCLSRDGEGGSGVCEWDEWNETAQELCWEPGGCDAYAYVQLKSNCHISQNTDQVYCS